jgi:hypothetical protein
VDVARVARASYGRVIRLASLLLGSVESAPVAHARVCFAQRNDVRQLPLDVAQALVMCDGRLGKALGIAAARLSLGPGGRAWPRERSG